jgi:predicted nucleic acid-binding protein
MQDKVFLDTNIIIYAYSKTDRTKQEIAKQLIMNNNTIISTQVLQEISNTLRRKLKMDYDMIKSLLEECIQNTNQLAVNNQETIFLSCDIAKYYGFSFYDSLIIAAALENGCTILYSEDLQHNQIIEQRLRIINPFS